MIKLGKGNVCTFGKAEGLIYIDYDDVSLYQQQGKEYKVPCLGKQITNYDNYQYLEQESEVLLNDILSNIVKDFSIRFPSFQSTDFPNILLENNLFTLEQEDNGWSLALKLLQKEQSPYEDGNIENLQLRHYKNYLEGLQECALTYLDSIGIYTGPWTHGTLTKDDLINKNSKEYLMNL